MIFPSSYRMYFLPPPRNQLRVVAAMYLEDYTWGYGVLVVERYHNFAPYYGNPQEDSWLSLGLPRYV